MTIIPEIEKIKDIIIEIAAPEKIYLFGSYAYGTPNADSDYDFYIVMPDNYGDEHDLHCKITDALCKCSAYTNAIDLLIQTHSKFEERKPFPSLDRVVDRKGILLYAAE